jgi:hypothetical protein
VRPSRALGSSMKFVLRKTDNQPSGGGCYREQLFGEDMQAKEVLSLTTGG